MNVQPEIVALVGDIDFEPDTLKRKYLAERDKRLRADGNAQYVEVKAEFSRYIEDPVRRARVSRARRCSTTSSSRSSAAASADC